MSLHSDLVIFMKERNRANGRLDLKLATLKYLRANGWNWNPEPKVKGKEWTSPKGGDPMTIKEALTQELGEDRLFV